MFPLSAATASSVAPFSVMIYEKREYFTKGLIIWRELREESRHFKNTCRKCGVNIHTGSCWCSPGPRLVPPTCPPESESVLRCFYTKVKEVWDRVVIVWVSVAILWLNQGLINLTDHNRWVVEGVLKICTQVEVR